MSHYKLDIVKSTCASLPNNENLSLIWTFLLLLLSYLLTCLLPVYSPSSLLSLGNSSSTGSPAQSLASDDGDEDYDVSPNQEFGDDLVMEWARVSCLLIYSASCYYPCPQFLFVISLSCVFSGKQK